MMIQTLRPGRGWSMNSRSKQALPAIAYEETILQAATPKEESAKVCCPRREKAGSGPHLTKETQALLQLRLRAAALILLIGFATFLVRHVVGILTDEPLYLPLLVFHVFVVLVLGVCAAPLCRHCAVSLKKLRVSELLIFGLPAAFFLVLQHKITLDDTAHSFMPAPLPSGSC